ncbi:MAG: hypothetical protein JKY94_10020, partial [Rhodobacteraceae bacterium]|nr:hypothetical protein [Paracoccaceae bacterium]
MINLLERYLPFYDSEGGSGAGDGNGDGGDKGGENDSSGAGAAPSVDGGKAGADGVVGSPEASAEIYRPKGVAETMFGKTNEETIDKMATTINGYRNKENSKPGVPSEIGDYKIGDVPDDLKTYFGNLENDP